MKSMMNMMTPCYATVRRTANRMPDRYAMPFGEEFFREFFGGSAAAGMKVDVEDRGDSYLMETDLPGTKRENVEITVEDGVMTIAVRQTDEKKEENDGHSYVYRERHTMNMSRSFSLEGVDEEGITAEYADGVLRLTLPKKTEQSGPQPRRIEIAGGNQ